MHIERAKDYYFIATLYVLACCTVVLFYIFDDNSLGIIFLFNLPAFLVAFSGLVSTGRRFFIDKSGCTVYFWKFKKKYTWQQLKTKRIERYNCPSMLRGGPSPPYLTEVILFPRTIHKPLFIRPSLYSMLHPFSCIYFNFALKEEGFEYSRYYEVEEETFLQRMKEWGVDLEEKRQRDGSVISL